MSVLGSDDFNVNYDITEDFYKYLEKNKGQLKHETCWKKLNKSKIYIIYIQRII